MQNYSVGDVGPNYVPMPGYIGTLAPGILFPQEEESMFKNLPNKVFI